MTSPATGAAVVEICGGMVGKDEVAVDVATTKLVGSGGGGKGLIALSGKIAIKTNKPQAQTDASKHKIVKALTRIRTTELLPRRGEGVSNSSVMSGEYRPKPN